METVHLPNIAKKVRRQVLEMIYEAGEGHLAGSLSATDLLVAVYFGGILQKEDHFILSCGHYCPALYAVLSMTGLFPEEELKTFKKLGTRLQGHPHRFDLPGIETSSGPLGQGLSQAAGIALGMKMDKNKMTRVYCLMSDAEQQKGQVWEAAMFAAKYNLNNLLAIIDKNEIQIDGFTNQIMPLQDLAAKYLSFGWKVFEIDGHRFDQILEVLGSARKNKEKPIALIARTIAGKGVSFMEEKWEWHHGRLSNEQYKKALEDLK